jgi:hypothetical protein
MRLWSARLRTQVNPRVCVLQPDGVVTPLEYADLIARLSPFLVAQHPTIALQSQS